MVVAYSALLSWVFVTLVLFSLFRPPLAAAMSFLGGTMFLPSATNVNPPILPTIGKEEVISACALLASYIFAGKRMSRAKLGRGPEILIAFSIIGGVFSVFNNMDVIRVGPVVVPGTDATDFIADGIGQILRWGIPFFVGRAMFTSSRDARTLLVAFAVAGFIYSFPIMIELRISPQLHRFVYGFYQHAFVQTIRGSGYRPMVFMAHGLNLSLFVAMCVIASVGLWRIRQKIFVVPSGIMAGYLGVILIACKSTGSILYGMLIAPVVAVAPTKIQMRIATALALMIFSYPVLRAYNVLPFDEAIQLAIQYSGKRRAHSLAARLHTEQTMIERIKQRPWVGWASAGRSAIRDETTGRMTTTYDGYWVILLSQRGIIGYSTTFGMLLLPVLAAMRALPQIRDRRDRVIIGTLSLMIVVNVFDLIPNSTTEGYLTLMSGALAGTVPGIRRQQAMRRRAQSRELGLPTGDGKSRVASLLDSGPPRT